MQSLYIENKRSIATVEYEGRQHFIKDIDYNYEEEEQIKLMYKAVYQLNDIEKH
jgi:RNA polymerase sigma-70 factor (ECF subfamily)